MNKCTYCQSTHHIVFCFKQTQLLWIHSELHPHHPFNPHQLLQTYSVDSSGRDLQTDLERGRREPEEDPFDDYSSYDEYEADDDEEDDQTDRLNKLPDFLYDGRLSQDVPPQGLPSDILSRKRSKKHHRIKGKGKEGDRSSMKTNSCHLQNLCHKEKYRKRKNMRHCLYNLCHQQKQSNNGENHDPNHLHSDLIPSSSSPVSLLEGCEEILVVSPQNISMTCGHLVSEKRSQPNHCFNNNSNACYFPQTTRTSPSKTLSCRDAWSHPEKHHQLCHESEQLEDNRSFGRRLLRRLSATLASAFESGNRRRYETDIMKEKSSGTLRKKEIPLERKEGNITRDIKRRDDNNKASKVSPSLSSSSAPNRLMFIPMHPPSLSSFPAQDHHHEEENDECLQNPLLTEKSLENSLTVPCVTLTDTTSSTPASSSCIKEEEREEIQSTLIPSIHGEKPPPRPSSSPSLSFSTSSSFLSSPQQNHLLLDVSSCPSSVLPVRESLGSLRLPDDKVDAKSSSNGEPREDETRYQVDDERGNWREQKIQVEKENYKSCEAESR